MLIYCVVCIKVPTCDFGFIVTLSCERTSMEQVLQQVYLTELYNEVEAYAATKCPGCNFLEPNKLLHSCIHWTFLEKYTSYLNHGGDVNDNKVVQLALLVQKDLQLPGDFSKEKCLEFVRLIKQVKLVQLYLPVEERVYSLINNLKVKQVMQDVVQENCNLGISSQKSHNDIHLVTPGDLVKQTTSCDSDKQNTSD